MSGVNSENEALRGDAAARSLVREYGDHSPFFFASARRTLLAQPEHTLARLNLPASERLASVLADKLSEAKRSGAERPILAGAIPFDPAGGQAPFWLLRGAHCLDGRSTHGLPAATRGLLATAHGYSVRLAPPPHEYVAAVSEAVRLIRAGQLDKVVLARALSVQLEHPIAPSELLRQLVLQNRSGYAFALDVSASEREPRTLLGVSPELLLEKRAGRIFTNPLAGSRPRSRDRVEDEALARELLASRKDRHEHALVIDQVASALRPFCKHLEVPAAPSLLSTPAMWHLSSEIRGELADPRCSSLQLAQALHPTPAVCGQPRARAAQLIAQLEGFERGLFAGAVGYCDEHGDGEWAVTLRCAELSAHEVRMWAGAGIVAESEPWAEFDETAAKLGTVLRALGLFQVEAQA